MKREYLYCLVAGFLLGIAAISAFLYVGVDFDRQLAQPIVERQ